MPKGGQTRIDSIGKKDLFKISLIKGLDVAKLDNNLND